MLKPSTEKSSSKKRKNKQKNKQETKKQKKKKAKNLPLLLYVAKAFASLFTVDFDII